MNSLLSILRAPRPLPPPDPNCRTYDLGQTMLLLRNHERSFQVSAETVAGPSVPNPVDEVG